MSRISTLSLPLLLLLAGCGGDSSSPTPAAEPNITFASDLTSQFTNLKSLNGGTKTAGWNQLTGTTTLNNGANADVEILGNVDYTNGSGPFFGFLTVELADGSLLTARMQGHATKASGSTVTQLDSDLEIVGGTQAYANATGTGHFTGSRDAALGGPIHINVDFTAYY